MLCCAVRLQVQCCYLAGRWVVSIPLRIPAENVCIAILTNNRNDLQRQLTGQGMRVAMSGQEEIPHHLGTINATQVVAAW